VNGPAPIGKGGVVTLTEQDIRSQTADAVLIERWRRRAHGGAMASIDDHGERHIQNTEITKRRRDLMPPAFGPLASHKARAALPTDAAALRSSA
jgi:hypothetical protein